MILETILTLLTICICRAVLSVPGVARVHIQVDFLHWRDRISSPATQQGPQSDSDLSHPFLSVSRHRHHQPPHLLCEQVGQDVEVSEERQTD